MPITNDSKDPNGSLLNGLKSKKQVTRNVAFWELALITSRFPERRKSIFTDEDRKKGPAWKQIIALCLAEICNINSRIDAVTSPSPPPSVNGAPQPVDLVPRISVPLKDEKVTGPAPPPENRLQKIENLSSSFARTHSSPENARQAKARQLITSGAQHVDQGLQQSSSIFSQYFRTFCLSPVGYPFRHCLRRTANVVVNGEPYSRLNMIANAITTIARLSTASLQEDVNGLFHKDVPEVVRVFCAAIKKIEAYVAGLKVHFTDVDCLAKSAEERKKVEEVEIVVDLLKDGLEKILRSFAEYLGPMGLERSEIREAKELVARRPQMAEKL